MVCFSTNFNTHVSIDRMHLYAVVPIFLSAISKKIESDCNHALFKGTLWSH